MSTQFTLTTPDQNEHRTDLYELCSQAKYTLLFFYPKDSTSWCTLESQAFSQLLPQFQQHEVQIIGVSKDSHKSHCNFQTKYSLQVPLIADTEHVLIEDPRFDVWKEKSMYGRKYMGVSRDSFLLNEQGEIVYEWRSVKPATHPHEVLAYIESL